MTACEKQLLNSNARIWALERLWMLNED